MQVQALALAANGGSALQLLKFRARKPSAPFHPSVPICRDGCPTPLPPSLVFLDRSPISLSSLARRLPLPRSSLGHGDHHHDHHDHHHDDGRKGHGHSHRAHAHGHGIGDGEPTGAAATAILRFARAVGWADLADLLREHLQLCCCSMVLLLLAAACPFALPERAARPLQNGFIALAFPLVGFSDNVGNDKALEQWARCLPGAVFGDHEPVEVEGLEEFGINPITFVTDFPTQ